MSKYRPEIDGPKKKAEYWKDPQKFRDRKKAEYESSLTPEQREQREIRRAKHAEYMRQYYADHPGYKAAADKKHRQKYLEKLRQYDRWRRMQPERKAALLAAQRKRYTEKKDEISAYGKAYYQKNKQKWVERGKKRNARPIEVKRLEHRKWALHYKHGMTIEQYNAMFEAQGGVCAICSEPPTTGINKRLHVDHDHKTEVRRGLLCMMCNHALERLEKYTDWHEKALSYLKRPR